MPQLYEIIKEKESLERKIEEIKTLLRTEHTDDLAEEFVALLELKQSKKINIHRANIASKLNIGNSELDITTAVIIRDTVKEKVDYLTLLIEEPECKLNKLELMKQRDQYLMEYNLLNMGILKNDLNVSLG